MLGRELVLVLARRLIETGSVSGRSTRGGGRERRSTLLLLGTGGSGRTATLGELAEQLGEQPHVVIDAAAMDSASVLDLLTSIVVEFARVSSRRWRFRRFLVGRLVAAMSLPSNDPEAAQARVLAELRRFRDPATLAGVITPVMRAAGITLSPESLHALVQAVLNSLTRHPFTRRVTLRSGMSWYAHQDTAGRRRDPIQELVRLNTLKSYGGPSERDELDRVLFGALLADLREAAGYRYTVDPVLLLDNADHPVAIDFLTMLDRTRFGLRAVPAPDRLTVVAAGRSALLDRLQVNGRPWTDLDVHRALAGDQLPVLPWIAVQFRDLSETEMFTLAERAEIRDERLLSSVLVLGMLTKGHPGATSMVMRVAAAAGGATLGLRQLLALPDNEDEDRRPVLDSLLRMLLGELGERQRSDLAVLAAARNWREAQSLAQSRLLTSPDRDRAELLSLAFATVDAQGDRVMHPVLRRLLLCLLASRPSGHYASWQAVFGYLAETAADLSPEVGGLPHLLSLGDVEVVARRMLIRLSEVDGETWLREARALTEAPALPTDWGLLLADWAPKPESGREEPPLLAVVTRVIIAGQAVNDPFAVAGRADMYGVLTTELMALASRAQGGFAAFVECSEHQQTAVRLWRSVLRNGHWR
ncbi:hypothetical protein D5S17_24060 [Pseudonocardiaceae bacterium YIM PH 21723]|nr:hypothetical protein D5S17_24060 [Pseudonocardiaceae bacterium YIM PH 21723]